MGCCKRELRIDVELSAVDELKVDVVMQQMDIAAVSGLGRVEHAHTLRMAGNALQLCRVLRAWKFQL